MDTSPPRVSGGSEAEALSLSPSGAVRAGAFGHLGRRVPVRLEARPVDAVEVSSLAGAGGAPILASSEAAAGVAGKATPVTHATAVAVAATFARPVRNVMASDFIVSGSFALRADLKDGPATLLGSGDGTGASAQRLRCGPAAPLRRPSGAPVRPRGAHT